MDTKTMLDRSWQRAGVFEPRDQAYRGTRASPAVRAAWVLSAIIAVLMVVASAAGLWIHELYQDPTSVSEAFRGGDLVTLVVAAPVLAVALLLAVRGSRRAELVWVGVLAYSVYNYAFYVFGAAFNDVFLLHVGLFSLSVFALALALATLDVAGLGGRFGARTPARWIGGYLLATAAVLGGMWSFFSLRFAATGTLPDGVLPASAVHLVYTLDLGLLVPSLASAGVLLWRRRAWGLVLGTVLSVYGAAYQLNFMAATVFQATRRWRGFRRLTRWRCSSRWRFCSPPRCCSATCGPRTRRQQQQRDHEQAEMGAVRDSEPVHVARRPRKGAMMRTLVVFESMFGNTQVIANAVADGLSRRMRVDTLEVGVAPTTIGDDVALLIVGGPTHAFGMSRPGTRQDATKQASHGLVSAGIGLREWLAALQAPAGVQAATFDTRINKPRLPGSAARAAAKRLRRLGFRIVAPAESFYVEGTLGPLLDGEQEHARRWGEKLGSKAGESGNVRRFLPLILAVVVAAAAITAWNQTRMNAGNAVDSPPDATR